MAQAVVKSADGIGCVVPFSARNHGDLSGSKVTASCEQGYSGALAPHSGAEKKVLEPLRSLTSAAQAKDCKGSGRGPEGPLYQSLLPNGTR